MRDGDKVGDADGLLLGYNDGDIVGWFEGNNVESANGNGFNVGDSDGYDEDGLTVGFAVGVVDGLRVVISDGSSVGNVGCWDGLLVGGADCVEIIGIFDGQSPMHEKDALDVTLMDPHSLQLFGPKHSRLQSPIPH